MKVWMLWVQGDGGTWLEAAWDDETTSENGPGWDAEVERVRKLAYDNKYEMRVQEVEVPGVYDMFEIPTATAQQRRKGSQP
jgi:hypothetical protein